MDKVREIIRKKPALFIIISLIYLIAVGLVKWQIHPPVWALTYLAGGLVGIYFMDAAEEFFRLTPSPFRSIVFGAMFVAVSLFVVTSSGSFLASGLVLSLYLSMILWQIGEWRLTGNLNSWYRMVTVPVSVRTQLQITALFILLFLVETFLFIR